MIEKFEDIQKALKKREFKPVYFLDGDEPWFLDQLSNYIEKNVLSEAEKGFNQMTLYGKDSNVSTIMGSAKRYPMMSPYQVIVVKEAQHLKDIGDLEPYMAQPVPTTILVFNFKYKKLDQRTKLAKTLKSSKGCVYFTAKALRDYQVQGWITKYVKSKKFSIEPDALQVLAENLGTKLSNISNEIDKLLLNLPPKSTIGSAEIEKHIGINRSYNSFELQKALANRQVAKAHRIISYFAENPKAAPFPLLMGTLYNFYSKLFLFHHYASRSDQELQKIMGLHSAFFVKEFRTAAQHYSLPKVRKNLGILLQYDLKSKGVEQYDNSPGALLQEMTYLLMN